MNDPPSNPLRYRVFYSGRVRETTRLLLIRARERGLGPLLRDAVTEIDRLLQIYPQFGQPLRDLAPEHAQLWVGVVAPLVVHYVIDEPRRHVLVGLPLMPLPNSGL